VKIKRRPMKSWASYSPHSRQFRLGGEETFQRHTTHILAQARGPSGVTMFWKRTSGRCRVCGEFRTTKIHKKHMRENPPAPNV
jgi:hypothetical protein